jgi:hypothetical protein
MQIALWRRRLLQLWHAFRAVAAVAVAAAYRRPFSLMLWVSTKRSKRHAWGAAHALMKHMQVFIKLLKI